MPIMEPAPSDHARGREKVHNGHFYVPSLPSELFPDSAIQDEDVFVKTNILANVESNIFAKEVNKGVVEIHNKQTGLTQI